MRVKALCCAVLALCFISAEPALAHAPVPGIKGFYIGLIHPFSTPAQALLILGVGLVTAGFPVSKVRWFVSLFFVMSVLGVFVGSATFEPDMAMYCAAVVACTLAALAPGKFPLPVLICAALGGLLIGFVSVPDDGPARDRLFTMTGSIAGANIGLLYLYGISSVIQERFEQDWIGIGFRVLAAWLGAIALLMLALAYSQATTIAS